MLRGGKPGSKVIVTTRSERIAKRMNSKLPFKLDALPGEDCWNLFRTMAFPAGVMDPQTLEKEKVGQQIVERCRGVPLAVKSLAYRLQNEPLRRWEETLKSDLWEEEQNPTSATRSTAILPSLKLSYYYMPEYLRPCFAYFAVFPKGFVVEKISLIQRWTALGFVAPTHHPDDYLQELVGMSFLQAVSVSPPISQRYCKPPSTLFQMHDLVHQLAMSVSSDEVAVSDGSRGGRSCLKMENCRYMLFSNFNGLAPQRNGMPSKARAIHFKDCTALKPSPNIFSKTEWLRVLDLSGLGTGELPESMKNLHHLQVLNLSENTCLTKLPSLICDFQKLSYLDLHSCSSIIELPESIHKLNELIYLDLSKCSSLRELPMNSRGLQKLSSLNLSGCSQLEKLPDTFGYLKNLKDLNMSFCCQLKQLQTGFFNDMKEIRFLNMQRCSNVRELPDSIRKVEELRYMDLSNCSSICKLPTITGGLQKLYSLNLSGCSQLEKIPDTFGCLKNLKDLNMSCCCRLKQLPADFFKDMKEIRYLNFSGCASLWELPELGGNNRGHLLEMLDLSGCAELSGLPESYSLLSELQHLNLSGCSKLQNITVFLARHKLFRLEYLNLSGVGLKGDSELVGTSSGQGSQNPKAELWQLSLLHGLITQSLAHLKYLSVGGYTLFSEQGIATLEDLQTLPIFRVRRRDKDGGSNIVLLGKILDATQRDLHIECLENVVTPEEMDKVEIGNKQLHSLTLEWSSGISQFECKAKRVLEKLRPHRDLQVLTIKGYGEDTFPDWIMTIDDALPNLVKIVLSDVECKDLPPLGNMPNLQDLEIRNVHCLDFSLIGRWQNLRRLSLIALRDTTLKLNVDGNEYKHIPRTEYDMTIDDGRTKRKCKEIYEKVKRFWKLFSKEPGHTEETEAAMPMPEANAELARFSSDKNPELPILEHLEIESCLNLEFYPWMPKSALYSITHSTRKFEDTEPFIRFNLTRETFYGRPETFYERAQRSTINIRCSPPTSRSWI
uniref:Uncharacterized protein n=1 Tax=Oryza glumipatula TaxID=40148 RepID=A0A0E0ACF7_9ORYZ